MLYGVGEDGARARELLSVSNRELCKSMREHGVTIENTLFELDVEGRTSLVLPRQIQIRTGHEHVVSCSFLRFSRGTLVDIPVRFVDSEKNPYLRRGGYLHRVTTGFIKCHCDTLDIPSYINISVARGGRNHVIRLDDVVLPPGLRVKPPRGPGVIAVIKGRSLAALGDS